MVILFGSKRRWTFFETRRGTVLADRQAFYVEEDGSVFGSTWTTLQLAGCATVEESVVSVLPQVCEGSSCVSLYICCCHIWHTCTHDVSCCVMLWANKPSSVQPSGFHYRQLLSSHQHLRIHMYICMDGWDLNTGIVSFPNMFPSEGGKSGNETQPLHGCVSAVVVWTHTVGGRRGGCHRQQ